MFSRKNNFDLFTFLSSGLDLHIPDKSGNTAFATAMTSKNNKAAQKILQLEPQAAEQFDPRGRNFLHTAIIKGVNNSHFFLTKIVVIF